MFCVFMQTLKSEIKLSTLVVMVREKLKCNKSRVMTTQHGTITINKLTIL